MFYIAIIFYYILTYYAFLFVQGSFAALFNSLYTFYYIFIKFGKYLCIIYFYCFQYTFIKFCIFLHFQNLFFCAQNIINDFEQQSLIMIFILIYISIAMKMFKLFALS